MDGGRRFTRAQSPLPGSVKTHAPMFLHLYQYTESACTAAPPICIMHGARNITKELPLRAGIIYERERLIYIKTSFSLSLSLSLFLCGGRDACARKKKSSARGQGIVLFRSSPARRSGPWAHSTAVLLETWRATANARRVSDAPGRECIPLGTARTARHHSIALESNA